MSKMDRQGARTPADLERKYNFGRSFAELRNIALDAQTHVYTLEETVKRWSQSVGSELQGVYAELALKIETDENDNLIGKIHIGGDQLTIDTKNFILTEDGTITAKAGYLGGWGISSEGLSKETTTFTDTAILTEKTEILPNKILCSGYTGVTGTLFYFDKQVQISNGTIHITRAGTGTVVETAFGTNEIPFMDVTLRGTRYQLYIDTATLSVKAAPVE